MAKKEKLQMAQEIMTPEESKAFKASLAKPEVKKLSEKEKREAFRLFWTKSRKQYGKSKSLEDVLWMHLKSQKMDEPAKFEDGLKHFGLKKIK